MRITDQDSRDLLEACRHAEPEVLELASAVALAARVEQPLLRRARLRLCPRLDAGVESALWFSPIISSRSASAIVIDRDILALLREELQAQTPSWLPQARELVSAAHMQEPDALRLEEEVIWLAVWQGDLAAPEIDQRLRSAIKTMVTASDQGLEVARWADRALLSLPEAALRTQSAALLAVGSASRLQTGSQITDVGAFSELPQGARWLLAGGSQFLPAQIGVRLRQGEVELCPAGALLSQTLELDAGESDTLEISWSAGGNSDQRIVVPPRNQRVPLPQDCREVQIRTASGRGSQLKLLDSVNYGLRFGPEVEPNFVQLPRDLQAAAESALQSIACNTGLLGYEHSGGYVYRDPLHRCDIWYRFAASSTRNNTFATLEVQDVQPVRQRLFISYSHEDYRWVELIVRLLPKYFPQLEIWIDRQQLKTGEPWSSAAEQALVQSTSAVVFLSPAYLSSQICQTEASRLATLGRLQHLAVFPVRVTDLPSMNEVSELMQFQFLDTEPLSRLGDDPSAMEHLVQRLAVNLKEYESGFSTASVQGTATQGTLQEEWAKFVPAPRPLIGDDQCHVFISYRSVDRPWVLNLYDVLTRHGYKVFFDQMALPPGDNLRSRLQDALARSQSGVLIWSGGARDSQWLVKEWDALDDLASTKSGFYFVPIALDRSELPLIVKRRAYLDFSSYPDGPGGGELIRLFYAIAGTPLSREAAEFVLTLDRSAEQAADDLEAAIFNKDPYQLLELFKTGGWAWQTSSVLACKAAEGLIKLRRNDDAIAMLGEVEKQFPRAIRPQQLHALALARRGQGDDLNQAQRILGRLYQDGQRDPETLGIYGRTWMDRYNKSKDLSDLRQSRDLYAEAFQRSPDDYYTGINAAAKSVLLGTPDDISLGASLAAQVQKIVGTEPAQGDYWKTATVGEVFLLLKNYTEAARLYTAAVSMAPAETGSHESIWKQACLEMKQLNPTADERALVRAAFSHLPDCGQLLNEREEENSIDIPHSSSGGTPFVA